MRRLFEALTTRGRAFMAAGFTLVAAGYGLGLRDLTRVGVLLVGLPLLTAVLARRRPTGLVVSRVSTPVQVRVDEPVQVITRVANEGVRNTPILLAEERLDYLLGERPRVLLGSVGPRQTRTIRYAVRPPIRGYHTLGPLTVQLRDPFGLSARFVEIGDPTTLLVLPRTEPLIDLRRRTAGIGVEGDIPHMVALHGEDDQSIREYRDGDDLRRIHWPATARTGELMVRQEDRPARRRVVVLLDSRAEAHVGSGPGSGYEWAVDAVASVAVHFAEAGYAVHLLTPETVDSGHADLPMTGEVALPLLAVTAAVPTPRVEPLLRAAQTLSAGGGLVVVVLAAYDDALLTRLAALRPPGSTGLALLLPGADSGPAATAPEHALDQFLGAGWWAVGVRAGDSVATAWQALAGGLRPATVGAPR